jgi:hypothetical protein
VRTRDPQETLYHQGELGPGQIPQRPFEEEQHGHKKPREKAGADDDNAYEDVSEGHDALPFFRLLTVLVPDSDYRPMACG